MKSISLVVFAACALSATAPAAAPATPEIQADGQVRFHLAAPEARAVALRFESDPPRPMSRDSAGVWSIVIPALAPDIYSYGFVADGVPLLDPNNPRMKYNLVSSQSEFQVPGPADLPWEVNDVPRGTIHRHFYHSAIVGDDRDFLVYTPPGYDPAASPGYPVLYLLHGFSDDATAWSTVGRANVILDNLIARGKAKPMLVVMPLGYGDWRVLIGGYSGPNPRGSSENNNARFGWSLLEEVVPQVEKSYRVEHNPAARAIAGLSMGGAQSLLIGLNHPGQFGWIGAFSAGSLRQDFAAAFPTLGRNHLSDPKLLWIACGREDRLLEANQQFEAWLTARGVTHVWHPTPGIHSFTVWRRNLADFVQLLFRP